MPRHTESRILRPQGARRLLIAAVVGIVFLIAHSAATAMMTPTSGPTITDKLMTCCHQARPANTKPDMVVLHFASDVIAHPNDPYDLDRIIAIFESNKVSSHYLIDRAGTIYRLVDEDQQAHHAGQGALPWTPDRKDKLNESSIGIELMAIGTKAEMAGMISAKTYDALSKKHTGYTDAQYKSLRTLLEDIARRRPEVQLDRKHVIGHSEYAPARKKDPGELFDWTKIGLKKTRDE